MKKIIITITLLFSLCSIDFLYAQELNYLGKHFMFDTKDGNTSLHPNLLYIFGDKAATISFLDSNGAILAQVNKSAYSFDSISFPFCCHGGVIDSAGPINFIESTDSVIIYECQSYLGYVAMHAMPPKNIAGRMGTYSGHPRYINWFLPYYSDSYAYIIANDDSLLLRIYFNNPHPLLINPPFCTVTIPPNHSFLDIWVYDYTGTIVEVDTTYSKGDFQIFSGNKNGGKSGDYMIPYEYLKMEYHTIPHLTRKGDRIRVVTFEDSTTVILNGNPILINRGQIIDTLITQPTTWKADKKIEVINLSRLGTEDSVLNSSSFDYPMFPDYSTFTRAQFSTLLQADSSGTILQNYINVLSPTNGTSTVTLDGASLTSFFSVFPDDSLWSYAQIPIVSGFHTMLADSGVLTYLYGYGQNSGFGAIVQGFEMKNKVTALPEKEVESNYISLSPNPANEIVNINISNFPIYTQLILMDITGKIVPINYNKTNSNSYQLNVKNLSSGIYLLQIKNNNKSICKKIVVKHF